MLNNIDPIKQYLDPYHRLKNWPSKRKVKDVALKFLGQHFECDRIYSHAEVNSLLNSLHSFNDCALLRRELYESKILNRVADGTKYWKMQ